MKSKKLYKIVYGTGLSELVNEVNSDPKAEKIVHIEHDPNKTWTVYSAVVELEPSDEMLRKEIVEMLLRNRPEVVPVNIDREIEKHPEGCPICTEKDCACHLTTVLPPE